MLVYKKLQRLAGFTARVTELIESVDSVSAEASTVQVAGEDDGIHFKDVTVYAPDGRLLVKNLNLDINPGESVFITGANGAGKTSIFRVLAGLWRAASGSVVRPSHGLATTADGDAAIFYVPQRPYLVLGTLRQQLLYPTWVQTTPAPGVGASKVGRFPFEEKALEIAGADDAADDRGTTRARRPRARDQRERR